MTPKLRLKQPTLITSQCLWPPGGCRVRTSSCSMKEVLSRKRSPLLFTNQVFECLGKTANTVALTLSVKTHYIQGKWTGEMSVYSRDWVSLTCYTLGWNCVSEKSHLNAEIASELWRVLSAHTTNKQAYFCRDRIQRSVYSF
jgi:hypothetical protein